MKILLTGCSGQLGKSIVRSRPNNINLISLSSSNLDLEDTKGCFKKILKEKPDWIINCAAYTNVDKAEIEREKAFKINHLAPKEFSKALSCYGGKLMQISTDYVFQGDKNKPYLVSDKVAPINVYGNSKALGENAIKNILKDPNQYIILRTSWLVSPFGKNFVQTILKLLNNKKEIKVVNDQIGSMTSTITLAKVCWQLIDQNVYFSKKNLLFPSINHWTEEGVISWYDIAIAIKEISLEIGLLKDCAKVLPITTNEYKFNALRPRYSVLECRNTEKLIKCKRSNWKSSLLKILLDIQKIKFEKNLDLNEKL